VVRRNERPLLRKKLAAGETWPTTIPAVAPRPLGKGTCTFDLLTDAPIEVPLLRFVR
jgi:hypothetical protein